MDKSIATFKYQSMSRFFPDDLAIFYLVTISAVWVIRIVSDKEVDRERIEEIYNEKVKPRPRDEPMR